MADDPTLRIFSDEFVPNIQGAPYHSKWEGANKNGDALRWRAFRDALLSGQTPAVPSMATKYGRALVAAGKEHMAIIIGTGDFYDTIGELTAVFLPTYTLSADITQGVTNPSGLGGGIWEINDGAGSGYRFVCTSQMVAVWDSTAKACLAFADIRPAVGLYEQWDFKFRYPSIDNPTFSGGFFAGTIFEFGHHQLNSGVKIEIDPRAGGEGLHIGVPINFNDSGSFDYYTIVDFPTFELDRDYVVDARLRYNIDNTGYVRVKVDGVTIVDQFRPMRPNTSEIPKVQFGWYSDRAAATSGAEIRNLQYAYGVA